MVHHGASFLYMVEHFAMLVFVDMDAVYARGFACSLAVFLVFTLSLKRVKEGHENPSEASNDALRLHRRKLPRRVRRSIFLIEFFEMVAEYAMFIFFVSGLDTARRASRAP